MTWTLQAGDVSTYQYTYINTLMIVNFVLATTTIGGTPGPTLLIKIPAGRKAVTPAAGFCSVYNNALNPTAWCFVNDGFSSGNIAVQKLDSSNFVAETNACNIIGTITFQTTTD